MPDVTIRGRPFGFVFTGGKVSDYRAKDALTMVLVQNLKTMLADRDYDCNSVR